MDKILCKILNDPLSLFTHKCVNAHLKIVLPHICQILISLMNKTPPQSTTPTGSEHGIGPRNEPFQLTRTVYWTQNARFKFECTNYWAIETDMLHIIRVFLLILKHIIRSSEKNEVLLQRFWLVDDHTGSCYDNTHAVIYSSLTESFQYLENTSSRYSNIF